MSLQTAREAFGCLWDSINAKRGYGWAVNMMGDARLDCEFGIEVALWLEVRRQNAIQETGEAQKAAEEDYRRVTGRAPEKRKGGYWPGHAK